MRLIIFYFFLFLTTGSLHAQKFLQMERSGSFKVKRYYPGEEMTFRLRDDDTWYKEYIEDILVEDEMVLFTHRAVKIEDITAIRSFKMQRWSKPIGAQLYNFAAGWAVFSLGGSLFGTALTWGAAIIPAIAVGTGFLIQKIFRKRTFRMSKKRRLRVLDLSFSPALSMP